MIFTTTEGGVRVYEHGTKRELQVERFGNHSFILRVLGARGGVQGEIVIDEDDFREMAVKLLKKEAKNGQ